MKTEFSEQAFAGLLDRLDTDRGRAGQRYEDLRRMLRRFFEWRAAPFPDDHADETLDRVARKLSEGVQIVNIGGYCAVVARLVYLETRKAPERKLVPIDATDVPAPADSREAAAEREARLSCLDQCLRALPDDSRALILEYYRDHGSDRIQRRQALAARLGLNSAALSNRAQRVRDRLEGCVTACMHEVSPT